MTESTGSSAKAAEQHRQPEEEKTEVAKPTVTPKPKSTFSRRSYAPSSVHGSPKAVLLDTELDKYSKEFRSPHSFMTKLTADIKFNIMGSFLKLPLVKYPMNRYLTMKASSSGTNRPYENSCKAEYTSYESLTDYSFYGRHLAPASDEYIESLPPLDTVSQLFRRPKIINLEDGSCEGEVQTMCQRSTMLFPTFAQHLIDSFIMTEVKKDDKEGGTQYHWDKTNTPHDISLLTVYGRSVEQTRQLRVVNPKPGSLGRLKTQIINGEEWAPYYYDSEGNVKEEFNKLDPPQGLDYILNMLPPNVALKRRTQVFAFGGARTNLTPNVSAWNVLLIREHNRIAGELEKSEPTWDDERVFQTARNVLLAMYLKLVIEEYINHITKYDMNFTVRPGKWMWNAPWYKRNWISAEFAVLYRWHSIIPACMKWGKETVTTIESLYNNHLLVDNMDGLRDVFVNISNHRATAMGLFNTEDWMVGRDLAALTQGRACKIQPYVNYCPYVGQPKPQKFSDITKDPYIQKKLEEVYETVDRVEFWVGLLASDNPPDNIMSAELTKFVANDAFNQALTHPILSENVWSKGPLTFGKYGWELVQKVQNISDILERNTNNGEPLRDFVCMTVPDSKAKCQSWYGV